MDGSGRARDATRFGVRESRTANGDLTQRKSGGILLGSDSRLLDWGGRGLSFVSWRIGRGREGRDKHWAAASVRRLFPLLPTFSRNKRPLQLSLGLRSENAGRGREEKGFFVCGENRRRCSLLSPETRLAGLSAWLGSLFWQRGPFFSPPALALPPPFPLFRRCTCEGRERSFLPLTRWKGPIENP